MNNFRFAFRYLMKLRGSNFTRTVTLSLGLAVGLVICSYVQYLMTFDRFFPDRERIYQVWSAGRYGMNDALIAPLAPALAEEFPCVEAATRLKGLYEYELYRDDRAYDVRYMGVDTMFFDVLDFGLTKGDMGSFTGKDKIMLAESLAERIFGRSDPVGQIVKLKNEIPLTVWGVFRDPPHNTHLGSFDALVPFEYIAQGLYTGWDGGDSFATYVKLREGTTPTDFEALLPAFFERHGLSESIRQWDERYLIVPIERSSKTGSPTVMISWALLGLAALILFVASMNYTLISLSTLVSRERTFAMLRCNGARPADVRSIFLWETALVIVCCTLVAFLLIWALQGQIRSLTDATIGDLFAWERLWVPLSLLGVTFLLSGPVPAQVFASIPLSTAFRGAATGRRRWKQALLVAQIVCVSLSLTLLAVFSLQLHHLRSDSLGFDPDGVVVASLTGSRDRMRNIEQELVSMPEVASAGTTTTLPVWGYSGQPCFDETTYEMLFGCRVVWIDENYIPAIGMRLVAGKNLTHQSSPRDAIVNETYVRMREWTPESAVGRRIAGYSDPSAELYRIVGVVGDFTTAVYSGEVEPLVMRNIAEMMPDPEKAYAGSYTCIRLRRPSPEAVEAVQEKIRAYASNNNHRLWVLRELLDERLDIHRRIGKIVLLVSFTILGIALMGLVGYIDDEIRRRAKEVAIRKVNGASARDIVGLLSRRAAVLVVPAVAAGLALGYYGSMLTLELFVSRIPLRAWIFLGVAAAILGVVYAVLLLRTRQIARANPARMIKTE